MYKNVLFFGINTQIIMIEFLTDDCDTDNNTIDGYYAGNGDMYIVINEVGDDGIKKPHSVRISTSGGNFPTSIKIAAANFIKSMIAEQEKRKIK